MIARPLDSGCFTLLHLLVSHLSVFPFTEQPVKEGFADASLSFANIALHAHLMGLCFLRSLVVLFFAKCI